ncbi:MAG: phosphoribosylformylglycinamidine synthase subunit PurL [Alphaproteobacteria bacterium]|nr:phosphoribosylformylglycinamidine synthase subunit PurL [Alphaproteobacteria bacterium]MBU6472613.1 phosphoribosylformylglycinamidine synthase subunit PurL [Alphaproteobacteria bacterium]MDE2014433.1 phosphoribosylformylglycinamidine synthase subunit PurL [Alphaproteobacteria bacterium]
MTAITPQIVKDHGLSEAEYARIKELLGRDPNLVELGVFSVMWSEHCSYKSTRVHLKKLPTKAPWVLQGPGENAGVIDIGDGDACIFKMESHNHPSFIEPYQGAATGVGGIMRDVFTMGARPVAMMNALRFGAPDHPKTRHLVSGVVAGIGGYGNCMGVPTVGGEVNFHRSYNGNILVNAMCVGLARTDRIFLSAAKGAGNPVVYIGSKTGRDGIHGATMASAEFSEDSEEKRPTVQVGDPFTEKLLLEACLELMATDAIIAIQDMGAAGLTSSSAEMGDKGGSGIELDLDKVPQREPNMTAYDMMLSESQERMLAVLKPGREKEAEAIFRKWELDFAVIGITTDTHRLVVRHKGEVVADMPITALSDAAPVYERPFVEAAPQEGAPVFDPSRDVMQSLVKLVGSPDMCSRRWVWEQYDNTVMNDTVQRPGGDAAVVRVHGSSKGLAITTDVTPRYCFADPYEGAKQAVAESWRNICAVGGRPMAVTDNLNFGNPEKPRNMWQIVAGVAGIGEACRALDYPVISGNCSLYNETNGEGILPTPAIGGVGLLKDVQRMATVALKRAGDALILIGATNGHLGQSIYLREIEGKEEGAAPPVDLSAEKRNGDLVRGLIEQGRVDTCHDLSDGGLLAALAEMAMAGGIGAQIALPEGAAAIPFLFGEDQARYLVAVPSANAAGILAEAKTAGVPAASLGVTGGDKIAVKDVGAVAIGALRKAYEAWFPAYLGGSELPPSN